MFHLHLTSGQETIVGVVIGALLASVGGLLAGQIEHHLRRRDREQSAALLFGEILAALKLILRLANNARGRGDPYGPVTMRILRAAQRETQIYDRNRETLFDLRDPALRARTHLLLLQIGLTLDALFEASQMVDAMDDDAQVSDAAKAKVTAALASRDSSFGFIMELHGGIPPLLEQYQMIAKQMFDAHDLASQVGIAPLATPPGPNAA